MKTLFFLALLFFAKRAWSKETVIEMRSISFAPKNLQIKVGDEIKWKNVSYTDHSATGAASDGSEKFDTGLIAPRKQSKPMRFNKAGTYHYNCQIHGNTMSGVIEVSEK